MDEIPSICPGGTSNVPKRGTHRGLEQPPGRRVDVAERASLRPEGDLADKQSSLEPTPNCPTSLATPPTTPPSAMHAPERAEFV